MTDEKRLRTRAAPRDLPDADLIALCLADSSAAWDALIDRYAPLIYTIALRTGLSRSDAEDALQTVCLALYHHLAALRDAQRLPYWLITTTRRTAWRMRPREGTETPAFSEVVQAKEDWRLESALPIGKEAPQTPEEALLHWERQWLVRTALQHLTPACQRLLTLLYCEDPPASYAAVAQKLSMATNSVSPTRTRCLEHLEKKFRELTS